MPNFALTGAAGYVAPRHMKAIRDVGGRLVAAMDPHDSVGILDRYFPDAAFFTEFERFDRHLELLRRMGEEQRVHYLSICSPNHLHDAHARLALRVGADAICEKPLVLNPWNLDGLQRLEDETGRRVHTVLQLRVHPALVALREQLRADRTRRHHVRLTYVTFRGQWYGYSWKGDIRKSGGIATNIGIHFFDLLTWLFGPVCGSAVYVAGGERMGGRLDLENADVDWYLSLRREDLPSGADQGDTTYRSISVDGQEIEFSGGFTDLHSVVYADILSGNGFGIEEARPSIQLVHELREAPVLSPPPDAHTQILGFEGKDP